MVLGKNVHAYIVANILLLPLINLNSEIVELVVNIIAAIGIMTVGLAHGAIDNLLYGVQPGQSSRSFSIRYTSVIIGFSLLWLVFPNIAMLLFLVTSAYHFGQSQHIEYNLQPLVYSRALFLVWGGIILQLLFYFHGHEILALGDIHTQIIPVLNHLIYYALHYLILFVSVYVLLFAKMLHANQQPAYHFFKELYILGIITTSMYLFHGFLSATLFFVFIHSLKVMFQEFEHARNNWSVTSIIDFLRLFIPLSVASIAIVAVVILCIYSLEFSHLVSYILIILLSSVTVPHSFVMDKFYAVMFINNE